MTDAASQTPAPGETPRKSSAIWRFLPLLALVAAGVAGFIAFGDALSFETLRDNRDTLIDWRDSNIAFAALAFVGIYALVVALSIPGALWMTLLGGFLFGVTLGGPLVIFAATIGATVIFLVARTSLGAALREKAGPWLKKLEAGFQENAWSYMLMMRLVPAVPFFIANLAPAFLGARLSTFVWTTAVGIAPGTLVYASIGAGLGEVIDRGETPDLSVFSEPYVIGPLLGLAALSALPVLIKAFRGRGAAPSE